MEILEGNTWKIILTVTGAESKESNNKENKNIEF